ncbi:TRAP transporter substrate-binding protein DctP [Halomonas sp. Bachu 37]
MPFILSATLAVTALPVAAESRPLSIGDFFSTEHLFTQKGTRPWMSHVEEKTNGSIQFTHFPSSQAAPAGGLLDAVNTGVLDMALIGPAYHSEKLTLNSLIALPGLYDSAEEGSAALQSVMSEGPLREEFTEAGVVPIFSLVSPPYQVLLKDKQVGLPSEWSGLDIRTSGTTQAMTARALGASAVSLAGPEVYMGLERGRVEGVFFPLSSVGAYNLQEVVDHISSNGSFGGYSYALVINQKTFENLSQEERSAMLEAGEEISTALAKALDESTAGLLEEWRDQGINTFQFTDEELQSLDSAVADVKGDWVKRISSHDPRAAEALQAFESAVSNVSLNGNR